MVELQLQDGTNRRRSSKCWRNRDERISFSARLPNDVRGAFTDSSICAVKYSTNPFSDIRDSILEMIRAAGVQDWKEMEDLIYCYIVLNSSDVHDIIKDAFLSLLFF